MTPIEAMIAFKENIPIEHEGKVYNEIDAVIYKKAKPGGEIVMSVRVKMQPASTIDLNVAWCKLVRKEEAKSA